MPILKKPLQLALTLVAAALSVGACGVEDAIDSTDNRIDCSSICNRYKDCFDDGYDAEACTDRCHDSSNDDDRFEAQMEACNDCVDDASCSGAVFRCATECAGVVP